MSPFWGYILGAWGLSAFVLGTQLVLALVRSNRIRSSTESRTENSTESRTGSDVVGEE
ncbi:MAG: hypothetical protein OD811_03935 [Alphaproteobacteria bacterium]